MKKTIVFTLALAFNIFLSCQSTDKSEENSDHATDTSYTNNINISQPDTVSISTPNVDTHP